MSLPRYPAYKKSGVDWLGEVPAEWSLPKLKEFASFTGGGTPNRENMAFWNGDIPWVSPKDMKSERITRAEECITNEGLRSSATSLVPAGRVLMVVRSGILKHTIPVATNDKEIALNQDMKALAFVPEKCLSRFFLRWVQGLNDSLLLAWAKQGATVESIEHSYLANTVIPLPSLPEQLTILDYLDCETAKIDALIAEQKRLIELLQEKRQAVISHAVTKGVNPNAPMKDSGVEWLGEVPEHWEVKKIKHIGTIRYGIGEPPEYKEEGVPLIRATNICSGEITKENMAYVDSADIPAKRIIWLKEGDIIVVRSGALTGDSAIIKSEYVGSIAGFDMVLSCTEVVPAFVQYCLLSPGLKAAQIDISKQRAAQPHLNSEELGQCLIAEPPATEQREICDYLDRELCDYKSLIDKSLSMTELLRERRSALISAAVTGQIDVRGLATEEEP